MISRRAFLSNSAVLVTCVFFSYLLAGCSTPSSVSQTSDAGNTEDSGALPSRTSPAGVSGGESAENSEVTSGESLVYFYSVINPQALLAAYQALAVSLPNQVAVKISTGEVGGNNYLKPDLIRDLVQCVNGTIVECNTAYPGPRSSTGPHLQVAADHGFTAIAAVDILDSEGELNLPVTGGKHLRENLVGSHFANYASYLSLAHFKGHGMAGFGGAIKNIAIGIASATGKSWIHSAGQEATGVNTGTDQDAFLESMAEAAKSIVDSLGDRLVYVNVMNNLSVDCDCSSNPAPPSMADIGILASCDPVALDQACVDLVYAAPDGNALVSRMESLNGSHVLDYGEQIGLGSRKYQLIQL